MKEISENKITSQLIESISQLLVAARQKIVAQVNDTLVQTYFQIWQNDLWRMSRTTTIGRNTESKPSKNCQGR